MTQKIISQGAEAIIYLKENKITKKRISKKYRHPELDKKIIKSRTKAETKILAKISKIINVPKVEKAEEYNEIKMEFIEGDKLSEKLDHYSIKKQEKIMIQLGQSIAKMHEQGIIHSDLTTSNILLKEGKIFIIDFGLGFQNGKYEDKAVDIHLLKQALEAKHFKNWKTLFKQFEKAYKSFESKEAEKVFGILKKVEKRGRYKH
jgi:TP53 regulating kinase-like protein